MEWIAGMKKCWYFFILALLFSHEAEVLAENFGNTGLGDVEDDLQLFVGEV